MQLGHLVIFFIIRGSLFFYIQLLTYHSETPREDWVTGTCNFGPKVSWRRCTNVVSLQSEYLRRCHSTTKRRQSSIFIRTNLIFFQKGFIIFSSSCVCDMVFFHILEAFKSGPMFRNHIHWLLVFDSTPVRVCNWQFSLLCISETPQWKMQDSHKL